MCEAIKPRAEDTNQREVSQSINCPMVVSIHLYYCKLWRKVIPELFYYNYHNIPPVSTSHLKSEQLK